MAISWIREIHCCWVLTLAPLVTEIVSKEATLQPHQNVQHIPLAFFRLVLAIRFAQPNGLVQRID